ncbi:hypothetical protein GEMRC1_009803 [Eukaryota sp. GEM-RC1]
MPMLVSTQCKTTAGEVPSNLILQLISLHETSSPLLRSADMHSSFTLQFHSDDDDVNVLIDVDQNLDGFGRARMEADMYGSSVYTSYIHKLGVPNGVMETVMDIEGKRMCLIDGLLFPISNLYFSTLSLNGTIKYKESEVEVWVNKKGPEGAQLFYAKDSVLVAFGGINEDDSHSISGDVTSFEKRVFDRNHFLKPPGVICRRY